ncbi:hypothetical protein [Nitrosophilus kaiyonis]|uniref:hypothetical protein n=1 Tax=Nitrosophilus kaiyonis TaxID=2930200 RepID=UPI00249259A7|nr:hypothetical protein [Nitrosophilus kaiyonis]
MEKIALGKYAKMNRLSRAEVIKLIVTKKLKSEEIIENGRKKIYILIDDSDYKKYNSTKKDIIKEFLNKNFDSFSGDLEELKKRDFKILKIFKDKDNYFAIIDVNGELNLLKIYEKEEKFYLNFLKRFK